MRASSATVRSAEASIGLMSISLIHGCSTISWLNRTRMPARLATSIGRRPGTPLNALQIRVCSIIRSASVVLSGGSASARSQYTSTRWPPDPNSTTGPNCASTLLPTISSKPSSAIIGCTVTPRTWSAPAFDDTALTMRWYAWRTAASSCRFNWTPPTSVLWVIVSE